MDTPGNLQKEDRFTENTKQEQCAYTPAHQLRQSETDEGKQVWGSNVGCVVRVTWLRRGGAHGETVTVYMKPRNQETKKAENRKLPHCAQIGHNSAGRRSSIALYVAPMLMPAFLACVPHVFSLMQVHGQAESVHQRTLRVALWYRHHRPSHAPPRQRCTPHDAIRNARGCMMRFVPDIRTRALARSDGRGLWGTSAFPEDLEQLCVSSNHGY